MFKYFQSNNVYHKIEETCECYNISIIFYCILDNFICNKSKFLQNINFMILFDGNIYTIIIANKLNKMFLNSMGSQNT